MYSKNNNDLNILREDNLSNDNLQNQELNIKDDNQELVNLIKKVINDLNLDIKEIKKEQSFVNNNILNKNLYLDSNFLINKQNYFNHFNSIRVYYNEKLIDYKVLNHNLDNYKLNYQLGGFITDNYNKQNDYDSNQNNMWLFASFIGMLILLMQLFYIAY